jgi:hypothetical protein
LITTPLLEIPEELNIFREEPKIARMASSINKLVTGEKLQL